MKTNIPLLILSLGLLFASSAKCATGTTEGDKQKKDAEVFTYLDVDQEPLIVEMYFPDNVTTKSEGKSYVAVLAVTIDAKGKVIEVKKLAASDADFAEDTEVRAHKWRFEPAKIGSKNVSCATILTMRVDVGEETATGLPVTRAGFLAVKPGPDGKARPSERLYAKRTWLSVR